MGLVNFMTSILLSKEGIGIISGILLLGYVVSTIPQHSEPKVEECIQRKEDI